MAQLFLVTSLSKCSPYTHSPLRRSRRLGGGGFHWGRLLPQLRLLEGEVSKDLKRAKGRGKETGGPWKLVPSHTRSSMGPKTPEIATRRPPETLGHLAVVFTSPSRTQTQWLLTCLSWAL